MVTFTDMNAVSDPAEADQVMWGQVASPDGLRVMAFDVPSARPFDRGRQSFFVSVRGQTVEEVRRVWDGLSVGATVLTPIGPAAFSPFYGMLTDKFGITWVMDAATQHAG